MNNVLRKEISMSFETMNIIKEKIKRRRFQILVHSYIFYRLNDAIISDSTFNTWACELIELQKSYPEWSKEVELYSIFSDFDSVGCASMLPLDGDDALAARAKQLLNEHKKLYSLNS